MNLLVKAAIVVLLAVAGGSMVVGLLQLATTFLAYAYSG